MNRFASLLGLFVLSINLLGCNETPPPPPASGDPQASWPDEVKEAEARFEKQAKENATSGQRGR